MGQSPAFPNCARQHLEYGRVRNGMAVLRQIPAIPEIVNRTPNSDFFRPPLTTTGGVDNIYSNGIDAKAFLFVSSHVRINPVESLPFPKVKRVIAFVRTVFSSRRPYIHQQSVHASLSFLVRVAFTATTELRDVHLDAQCMTQHRAEQFGCNRE